MEPSLYRRVYRPQVGLARRPVRGGVRFPTLDPLIEAYAGAPRAPSKTTLRLRKSVKVGNRLTKSMTTTQKRTRVIKRVKKTNQSNCGTPCIPVCQNKILCKSMAKRRAPRRKTYRRRVPRPIIGIPNHRLVKLKTTVYKSVDPGAAAGGHAIYVDHLKLNSALDPTGSYGSGKPLYFDEYALMYNRYQVLGYTVSVQAVSTDNTNPIVVGFCPMPEVTGLASWMNYREVKGNIQKILTADTDRTWFKVKGGIRKQMLPAGGQLADAETLQASVTTDPERKLHGHIYVAPMDDTTDVSAVKLIITITQLVKFFVPVIPIRDT